MRYAIVTDTYPPDVNGVALTLQSYARGLRERGHAVEVIRSALHGESPGQDQDTLRIRSLRLPFYPTLRLAWPAGRRLRRHWRRAKPDAVYVATEGPLGWSAIRAARALGIPVVTALHTRFDLYMADYGMPWLQPVAVRWMRRFHNRADTTLVATQALAEFLLGHGFGRAVVLARAVDTTQFAPAHRDAALRAAWGLAPGALAVVHVGRIAAEKNPDLAVRAFRALQAQRPDARLVWIGDGPLRAGLERAHPDFVFCGMRRDADLARHFASGDLFLFPSRSETFGNVVLESMACGVPLVAFDHGAASEYLCDGLHGAKLACDDDAGFVAASLQLAGDDERRRAMGLAARESVLRLTPDRVAADLDALLSALPPAGRPAAAVAPSVSSPQDATHARA
ncbi:glycosyltransferase family 1 protein [Luteimonas sp. BDR2-5]|uniref:glycosyltransferase family 4 protein n=1 Tax=Proluteimonas luteida TaxID=2878685 RepID=UPI001E58A535|nr:glycosyltransferase family 1 protein [Luteimonas sp. BDR2-5]MCD9027597.1 glycosyltransferase family 1 protein [Luteimonas sp. BDR2-5]